MYLISLAYITFFLLTQLKISLIGRYAAFLSVLACWVTIGGLTWQMACIFTLLSGSYCLVTTLDFQWKKSATRLIKSVILLTAAALLLHRIPGFYNVLVLDNAVIGSTSTIPYSMYINYDKALAGLFVLLCLWHLDQVIGNVSAAAIAWALGAALAVVVLARLTLNLQLDFKWLGQVSLLFIFVKSFSTAFVEEIIFRGVIQANLTRWLSPLQAWLLASILFAVVHVGAGVSYVLTAFMAGLFYGYMFKKYQSILVAGTCHSLVNIIHFCFLTYPM